MKKVSVLYIYRLSGYKKLNVDCYDEDIVGLNPKEIPPYPLNFDRIDKKVEYIGKKSREITPELLCLWLIDICNLINSKK